MTQLVELDNKMRRVEELRNQSQEREQKLHAKLVRLSLLIEP